MKLEDSDESPLNAYVINGKDIVFAKILNNSFSTRELNTHEMISIWGKVKITSFVMSYTMIAAAEPL